MTEFTDAATIDGTRLTSDGYLIANVCIARTGCQSYRGSEIGRPDLDEVKVYRDPSEVFSGDSMASFAFKPVCLTSNYGHPNKMVDAKSWRKFAVGFASGDIARDGDLLRVPLLIADSEAIEAVRSGAAKQLSAGYTCDLLFEDGVTPDGEAYQARQVGIRANHISLVTRARGGDRLRVGDQDDQSNDYTTKEPDMAEATLRTALVDGLEIQTTHQGAQAIEKLQRQLSDGVSQIALKDAEIASIRADHVKAISAKDGEIAALSSNYRSELEAKDGERAALVATHTAALEAKDGEIAALKVQIPDAAALDARAAERTRVIDAATKLAGKFDPTGKPDTDIKRFAVGKKLGDAHATGKSDEYISAAFETLALTAASAPSVDPVRNAIKAGVSQVGDGQADPKAKWIAHLNNAWKQGNEPVAAA